jgi:hypothetical protein
MGLFQPTVLLLLGVVSRKSNAQLITHLLLPPRFRTSGVIPPILYIPSWGAGVPLLTRIPSLMKAKTKKLTYDSGKRTIFTLHVVKLV